MNATFLIVLFSQECLTCIRGWSLAYNKTSIETFKKS